MKADIKFNIYWQMTQVKNDTNIWLVTCLTHSLR